MQLLLAQEKQHYFNSLSIDDGLSQSVISQIEQDTFGFMWFGTFDGLNRFDGSKIKVYKNIPNDTTSLQSNNIQDLEIDFEGKLWVATQKGLSLYLPDFEIFKRIELKHIDKNNTIKQIKSTKDKKLWILSQSFLTLYNQQNNTEKTIYQSINNNFTNFEVLNDSSILIGTLNNISLFNTKTKKLKLIKSFKGTINSIELCTEHVLIATSKGVYCLYKNNFKLKKHFSKSAGLLSSNFVHHAIADKDKIFFASINGVSIYDTLTQKSEFIISNNYSKQQLLSNQTRQIFVDKTDNIWIGQIGGISWYTPKFEVFEHIIPGYGKNNNPNNKLQIIWAISKSSNNNIWIATFRQGLYRSKDSLFSNFKQIPSNKNHAIYSIAEDTLGQIWYGADNGLYKLNQKTNKINQILDNSRIDITTQIYIDSLNNFWLGTTGGLLFYNPKTDSIKNILSKSQQKIGLISKLYKDKNKLIIGGQSGLYWINIEKFYLDSANISLNNFIESEDYEYSSIVDIIRDSNQNLWFVGQNGLFLFNQKTKELEEKASLGIEQHFFYSIVEDTTGTLWISSGKGIYSYNPKNERLSHFNEENGMQNLEFNSNSKYIDNNGHIYFGGINGIVHFNPYNIPSNKSRPKVYIHKLKLFNNEIKLKDKSKILSKAILLTKKLNLNYKQNFFSIEFSSPEYYQHEKIIYAYKLSGLEKNWHYTTSRENYAQYTNVPAGKYKLLLKAQNSEGYWTDPPQIISIEIEPPFWKEIWFKIAGFLALISGVIIVVLYRERQLKFEKKVLEIKVKERTLQIEKARKDLEIEKLFSESIIQNAIDGIIVLDENNKFTVINQALSDILEYTKEDITKTGYFKLIPPKWIESEKLLFERVKNGEKIFAEKEFYHSSGKLIPVEVSTSCLELDKNKYIVAIIRDISKRKKLEIQLLEYNQQLEIVVSERTKQLVKAKDDAESADRLKTEFLANLSHEVRTPMNAINGFAQLLGMEHTNIGQKRRFVDLILDNSQKLLRLIEDIVDLSKFETGQIQCIYKNIALYSFLKEMQKEYESYLSIAFKDLKIEIVNNADENIVIKSDVNRLKQSLMHLIENSIKYTEAGVIKIGFELIGNKVMLFVEDKGIGIPQENLNRIFNVFEKPDFNKNKIYRGLGVGLALVKANAELLSCSLVVQSEVGKGTRVEIYHPAEIENVEIPEKTEASKISFEGLKFLIVEDEKLNYEVLANVLKSKKAEVNWASNGQIAIEKHNAIKFNAILMDIKMPIMDGIQATKIIKRQTPEIPLVVITAFNEPEQIKAAYKAGADFVISKPFKIDYLSSSIYDTIKKYSN